MPCFLPSVHAPGEGNILFVSSLSSSLEKHFFVLAEHRSGGGKVLNKCDVSKHYVLYLKIVFSILIKINKQPKYPFYMKLELETKCNL